MRIKNERHSPRAKQPDRLVALEQIEQGAPVLQLLYAYEIMVTAQDVCPEALCVSSDAERIYQNFWFLGDGLDDVPALLFGRGDE